MYMYRCIPGKIPSGFSGFTAEQLMVWTVIYIPVVLHVYGIIITPKALQTLVRFFCVPAHICVNPILVDVRLIKLMNYE